MTSKVRFNNKQNTHKTHNHQPKKRTFLSCSISPSASFIAKLGFLSCGEKNRPMNVRVFLVVAVAVILLFKKCRDSWSFSAAPSRWAGPLRRRAGRSSLWTSCQNLSPQSSATSGAGTTEGPTLWGPKSEAVSAAKSEVAPFVFCAALS